MIAGIAGRIPAVPQSRRRQAARRRRRSPAGRSASGRRRLNAAGTRRRRPAARRIRGSAPPGHLALSVDHRQRVPAPDHRCAARERHPLPRTTVLHATAGPAEHTCRISGGRVSLRTQPGEALVPRQSRRRRAARRSSASSSIRPEKVRQTLSICAAERGRPDASSAGRRSSISAVISRRTCGRRRYRHEDLHARCSISHSAPSRAETRPTVASQRNLLRHLTWSLPSGSGDRPGHGHSGARSRPIERTGRVWRRASSGDTPLWYYVLKEAELSGGARLVGVGARIVGEVFLGLLTLDEHSYLWRHRRWRPTLPSRARGTFGMVDLLTFAGVDPASRRQ